VCNQFADFCVVQSLKTSHAVAAHFILLYPKHFTKNRAENSLSKCVVAESDLHVYDYNFYPVPQQKQYCKMLLVIKPFAKICCEDQREMLLIANYMQTHYKGLYFAIDFIPLKCIIITMFTDRTNDYFTLAILWFHAFTNSSLI